jgi:hypothetical protein
MNIRNIPGIKKVTFIAANETFIFPKSEPMVGRNISIIGNRTELPLVDDAAVAVTDQVTDNGIIYTTKINGLLFDGNLLTQEQRHTLIDKYHTYQFTDKYGISYQVGTNRKAYPQITFSPTIENAASGARSIPFEITWTFTLPPLEITPL